MKCHAIITQDNYKKDRSVCRNCYCKYMLRYSSSKQGRSINQDSSSVQERSNNQDTSK